MSSLCSHFAIEQQTETSGNKCLRLFNMCWSALRAMINNFVLMLTRVTRMNALAFHSALSGAAR